MEYFLSEYHRLLYEVLLEIFCLKRNRNSNISLQWQVTKDRVSRNKNWMKVAFLDIDLSYSRS
jgi:hypothetical protein